jgi:rhamnogalacturonan endolyase
MTHSPRSLLMIAWLAALAASCAPPDDDAFDEAQVDGLVGDTPLVASGTFGLSSDAGFFRVDTGAGLVFKVRRATTSSTQSAGDLASLVYDGVEYQDRARGSQVNSGFGWLYHGVSSVDVSAATVGADYVKVTVQAGALTHYYLARRGFPHIYMATYFTAEPDVHGHARYIVRIPSSLLPKGPAASDIRNNTGAIEASDIFHLADGTTRSKHYSGRRLIDYRFTGATGNGVGIFMVRSNHEGGSGGPFYRSLMNQCGSDQEIYEIMNYGEGQTEAFRTRVLNGPYVLVFTSGANPPGSIDTSWLSGMGLTGYLPASGRGTVNGKAEGVPAGFEAVVGLASARAQYWTRVVNGNYVSTSMLPGSYTETLYKGELAVATQQVTVTAGATTTRHLRSAEATPPTIFRIGEWDGTPAGFLNAERVTTMHPSDPRMSPWGPVTFTVGQSATSAFPAYQWQAINNPTTVKFNLDAAQVRTHTVRVGLTTAFSGARPRLSVNGWTSATPATSTQPSSRTLTVGTYRGNNATYTFEVPASAFHSGTNTMILSVASGSGGSGFLSPGYAYDAVDLY